jgi:hypothetical protein
MTDSFYDSDPNFDRLSRNERRLDAIKARMSDYLMDVPTGTRHDIYRMVDTGFLEPPEWTLDTRAPESVVYSADDDCVVTSY